MQTAADPRTVGAHSHSMVSTTGKEDGHVDGSDAATVRLVSLMNSRCHLTVYASPFFSQNRLKNVPESMSLPVRHECLDNASAYSLAEVDIVILGVNALTL